MRKLHCTTCHFNRVDIKTRRAIPHTCGLENGMSLTKFPFLKKISNSIMKNEFLENLQRKKLDALREIDIIEKMIQEEVSKSKNCKTQKKLIKIINPIKGKKSDMDLKKYYKISELSNIVGIGKTTLRFWENEFKIKVAKNSKGTRYYIKKDIETFKFLKHLTHVEKFTLDGAKIKLNKFKTLENWYKQFVVS